MSDFRASFVVFCANQVGLSAVKTLVDLGANISSIVTVDGQSELEIKSLAKKLGIEFFTNENLIGSNFYQKLMNKRPFAALCVSYPRKIPVNILNSFEGGAFNFHPARLPHYRGCLPTVWPILYGDKDADYTIHKMDGEFDSGPVVDKLTVDVETNETGWSLYQKLIKVLPDLIKRNFEKIRSGDCKFKKQDERLASYFSNKLPNNGLVDSNWTCEYIDRFVRALYHPNLPVAKFCVDEKEFEIMEVLDMEKKLGMQKPGYLKKNLNKIGFFCFDGFVYLKTIRINGEQISLCNKSKLEKFYNDLY